MLLGFEVEPLPSWATDGGLGLVLLYAAYQVGRLASKLAKFVDDEAKRREAHAQHMADQRAHWKTEEELLRRWGESGVPQHVAADPTPIRSATGGS